MRFIFLSLLVIFSLNGWSQICTGQRHYISDFTFLNDGSLVIIGNSGVSGDLMDMYEENKKMSFRLARFSSLGIPNTDTYIDYTFPEEYFDYTEAAEKYNCEYDQVFQMNLFPDNGDGIFIYGSYLSKQQLILEFRITKDFAVTNRIHYMNQYFSGSALEQKRYWIRLGQILASENELKLNCKEYRIFDQDSIFTTRAGVSFKVKPDKGTTMNFINDGKEVTVILDGKIDCSNDHFMKKLVYYKEHYYVSVVNDYEYESCPSYGYDRIPFLYKINKKGDVIWKINCATMNPEFVSQPLILTGKGLLDENIGPIDLFKKKVFENGIVDSVITYFHTNGAFHYRVTFFDGKIKNDQIQYMWYDKSLYMEEKFKKGTRISRVKYYPGNEKKKAMTFYFDKEGDLKNMTTYSQNKKIIRKFLFENDTCIRKVIYNESDYPQRVEDLTFTNGKYEYIEPKYTFKISLTPYRRNITIKNPEKTLVIVQMDSTQKTDTAFYNAKSQTFDFVTLPSKTISKIIVQHPDFEKIEVINYIPKWTKYRYTKAFSLQITLGTENLEKYFIGFQAGYFKPYSNKIGVILKKADSTSLAAFYQLLETLPVKMDTAYKIKKTMNTQMQEPKNLWDYGGFVLNCDSSQMIPIIRKLQQNDLVKTVGYVKEYSHRKLVVFKNEMTFTVERKQRIVIDSLMSFYHLSKIKSSSSSLETWEYNSSGDPNSNKSKFYSILVSTKNILPKELYRLASKLYADSLIYNVYQSFDHIAVPIPYLYD